MEKLDRAQKCSILRLQNLGSGCLVPLGPQDLLVDRDVTFKVFLVNENQPLTDGYAFFKTK